MDHLSSEQRSAHMARVRGRNTKPELAVRSVAHAMGLRFRLHRADLPGTPDIAFPKHRMVVLVHGCFWHRHMGCRRCSTPSSRRTFWEAKFEATVARDNRQMRELEALGWRVVVIWECETKDPSLVRARISGVVIRPGRKIDLLRCSPAEVGQAQSELT
jgi:DNA mismatch endonuclease (patch repair protein)